MSNFNFGIENENSLALVTRPIFTVAPLLDSFPPNFPDMPYIPFPYSQFLFLLQEYFQRHDALRDLQRPDSVARGVRGNAEEEPGTSAWDRNTYNLQTHGNYILPPLPSSMTVSPATSPERQRGYEAKAWKCWKNIDFTEYLQQMPELLTCPMAPFIKETHDWTVIQEQDESAALVPPGAPYDVQSPTAQDFDQNSNDSLIVVSPVPLSQSNPLSQSPVTPKSCSPPTPAPLTEPPEPRAVASYLGTPSIPTCEYPSSFTHLTEGSNATNAACSFRTPNMCEPPMQPVAVRPPVESSFARSLTNYSFVPPAPLMSRPPPTPTPVTLSMRSNERSALGTPHQQAPTWPTPPTTPVPYTKPSHEYPVTSIFAPSVAYSPMRPTVQESKPPPIPPANPMHTSGVMPVQPTGQMPHYVKLEPPAAHSAKPPSNYDQIIKTEPCFQTWSHRSLMLKHNRPFYVPVKREYPFNLPDHEPELASIPSLVQSSNLPVSHIPLPPSRLHDHASSRAQAGASYKNPHRKK